jgi:hypothetical protein
VYDEGPGMDGDVDTIVLYGHHVAQTFEVEAKHPWTKLRASNYAIYTIQDSPFPIEEE